MRRARQLLLIMLEVILVFTLFGCGRPKYRLDFGGSGFQSRKTSYAAGETVTVYFDGIATDTSYRFWLDDDSVEMEQTYDAEHGYIFTFSMPDHDVTLYRESHNTMEYVPQITVSVVNEGPEADIWILPQTEENLKTTLWGPATVEKLGAGETAELCLTESVDAQAWLIRIIDGDHAYYSAKDVTLESGCSIVFRAADTRREAVIEVWDRSGSVVFSGEAFVGVLGAN